MVWTYFQLGQDMLQQPHAGRRQLLRELLQALRWPPGSVVFWPLAVPVDGRHEVNIGLFWRGLRVLGSKTVCCFGSACRSIFARELAVSLPEDQRILLYRTGKFLFLPEVEGEATDKDASIDSMCALLRDHGPGSGGGWSPGK
ncbi:MAG: hypothetical protein LDL30_04170 [Desulfovibrio sp.]|nr:hypothetical protein [Desulfovibrio sp.]MCA1986214.1 hypothetical protein [Desulfovibrio sp.]